jgi:hypothetical protein
MYQYAVYLWLFVHFWMPVDAVGLDAAAVRLLFTLTRILSESSTSCSGGFILTALWV